MREHSYRAASLATAAVLLLWSGAAGAADYYVALTGSDTNAGTLGAPFRTIQQAASVAVAGDNVYVRAGVYRETVRPANSGSDDTSRITFQPYNNEEVTVTGADVVSGTWVAHSGNIWKIDVPLDNSTDVNGNKVETDGDYQLFVNGWMAAEARWPNNNGYDPSFPNRATAGSLTYGTDSAGTASIYYPSNPSWAAGAKINFWPGVSYFLRTGTVTTRSSNYLNVSYTSLGDPAYSAKSGDPFFLWGKLEALDAPGEFFLDRNVTPYKLYLWAPQDANPNQLTVELKRRRYAFDLTSRHFITVRGFRLVGANAYVYSNGALLDGLKVLYASHLTQDVGTGYPDSYGMVLKGYLNKIQNCDIAYSAGSGVGARGHYETIRNNIVTDSDYVGANFAGIYLFNEVATAPPSGNTIQSNTVVNCAASGIFYNTQNVWTNTTPAASAILYNRVSSVCLQAADNGNIYTSGNGGNTQIGYNILNDNRANAAGNAYGYPVYGVTGAGLYLDSGVAQFNVHHNVTFGSMYEALRVNIAGKNLTIAHNTLLADALSLNNGYPDSGTNFTGNQIFNNIFRAPANSNGNIPAAQISVTNIFSTTDPLFNDAGNNDYTLQAGSPARDTGAVSGYAYVGSAPDQGAYEYGATVWSAGAGITPQSIPAPTLWSATAGSGSATLTWLPAPGWRYVIYRSDTSGYGYQPIATNNSDTLTYTNTGLTSGGPFYYTIKVERLGVQSAAFGNELSVLPTGSWPSAPTNLQAAGYSTDQMNLGWLDTAGNETGFEVWRKSGATGTYALLATLPANTTGYSDTNLPSGTSYTYRVRALNAAGSSAYSNEATGTTKGTPTAVTGPANGSFELRVLGDGVQDFDNYYGTWGLSNWVTATGAGANTVYMMDRTTSGWNAAYPATTNAPDGNQVLGLGRGGVGTVYQDLGAVTTGESYTLNGWLGRPSDTTGNGTGYAMQLLVGSSFASASTLLDLNNTNVSEPAVGAWKPFSGTSAVVGAGQNGQRLYLKLYASGAGGWPNFREWDQLQVAVIAPPPTFTTNVAASTVLEGVSLSWFGSNGLPYQVQWRPDLNASTVWSNWDDAVTGQGATNVVFDPFGPWNQRFYQVITSP
ncbi:MAG: fibronectin type III domain-containing protein [Verrucomicrobia bacterium]|jgi:hypothetical protein|nr:fibronectin type III domain-containing protein [Verrucomicrobiota bacterium]